MTVRELIASLQRAVDVQPMLGNVPLRVDCGEGDHLGDDMGDDSRFGWNVVDGHLVLDLTGGSDEPYGAVVSMQLGG